MAEEKYFLKKPQSKPKTLFKVSVMVNKYNARKNAAITMCVSLEGTEPMELAVLLSNSFLPGLINDG